MRVWKPGRDVENSTNFTARAGGSQNVRAKRRFLLAVTAKGEWPPHSKNKGLAWNEQGIDKFIPKPHFTWFYFISLFSAKSSQKLKLECARARACYLREKWQILCLYDKVWTPTDETQRDGHNRVWARGGVHSPTWLIMSNRGGAKPVRHERSWELHPVCPQFIAKANSTPS